MASPTGTEILFHADIVDAHTGAVTYLPASYVHLGYEEESEPVVCHSISTGLAFHTDKDVATRSGILEVLERDSLMITWMYPHLARRINIDDAIQSPDLRMRMQRCERAGITVLFVTINVQAGPSPIVMCILRSNHYPFHVVGTGSTTSVEQSCVKALDEAISIRFFCLSNSWHAALLNDASYPSSLEEHALFYARDREGTAFNPFFDADRMCAEVRWSQMTVSNIVDELKQEGLTVLWRDVTAPEIKAFGTVMRVVIPEALPLSQTFSARWLATPRLQRLAAEFSNAGYLPRHNPHPFS